MEKLIGLEEEKKKLASAVKYGIPALLIGETGTGKTSLAKEVIRETGRECLRVNCDGGTTPDELVGRYQLKGKETSFELGCLVRAMQAGSGVILDEINSALPDTLFVLHSVLEDEPRLYIPEIDQEIKPKEGFSVVATMNPSHEYAGTKTVNVALFSRFGVVIRFPKLAGADLLSAVSAHVPGAPGERVVRVVEFLDRCEDMRKKELIQTRLTIREAISALRLSMDGLTEQEAFSASLVGKFEADEIETLKEQKALEPLGGFVTGLPAPRASVRELIESLSGIENVKRENEGLKKELQAFQGLRQVMEAFKTAGAVSVSGAGGVA